MATFITIMGQMQWQLGCRHARTAAPLLSQYISFLVSLLFYFDIEFCMNKKS